MTTPRCFGNVVTTGILLSILGRVALGAELCADRAGRLASIDGNVEVQAVEHADWQSGQIDQALCRGDTVRVGKDSRAAVVLTNDAVLRLAEMTTLRLIDVQQAPQKRSLLELIKGAVQSFSRSPRSLSVNTPYVNGLVEGTEFLAEAKEGQGRFALFEGKVLVSNAQGEVRLAPGEEAVARKDVAPQSHVLVRPRDAVQWAIYYPPILSAPNAQLAARTPELAEALAAADSGRKAEALAALERVPVAQRGPDYYVYNAALLLDVGKVQAAQAALDNALKQNPSLGSAHALAAIVNIVRNDKQAARRSAEQAVANGNSAAGLLAMSYVQQSEFKLEEARAGLRTAVERYPNEALLWARLGELNLMLGENKAGLAAAAKAQIIAPKLVLAQKARGFAALAAGENREAKVAFDAAVQSDSADPLGHLGRGLTRIASGDLAGGRSELEVAVALDGNNALLRSYLGKAYFEEKRAPHDAQQFAIAKEADPLDPTAYLYDGIRKQSENSPVEAYRDFQAAAKANDNRAVYRSRLLLDKDRASRGASLARVYRDLGFAQLGVREATKSIDTDPGNSAAHRFLSDSYLGVRRREIARVSELLQAQLLQDVNVNPIQPSVSETNLNIFTIGGPAQPGFNEFTPLFQKNMAKFDATAFGGNFDTVGGEGVATALYDKLSLSAGGYAYNSSGWRENNGLNQHIYNFFAQYAVSSNFNVQAEYRRRESEEGDLAFNFDPADFLRNGRITRDLETARLGMRYNLSPRSTLLFSYIYSQRGEARQSVDQLDPLTALTTNSNAADEGHQFEGQYLYEGPAFSLVSGFAYNQVDRQSRIRLSAPGFEVDSPGNNFITNPRGYAYLNFRPLPSVLSTVGFSYEDYKMSPIATSSFNPKLGLQWEVTDRLRLRAALFRAGRSALANNRTIEPTQVGGFNQLFDDLSGVTSWRYGGGVDWRLTDRFALGAEATWRQLDEPFINNTVDGLSAVLEKRNEVLHTLYLSWTPTDRLTVRAEFVYDLYKAQRGSVTDFDNLPVRSETLSAPIAVTYFHPSGFFVGGGGTFVNQTVRRAETATRAQGSDNFFLVDTSIGYRFPKRLGSASIGIRNLFDTEFRYQDDSYREFRDEPSTGPYFPERTVLARVSLSF